MACIFEDLHTHTVYSHGKGTPRDNVERAMELGFTAIAITDHASAHVSYGVRRMKAYLKEIEALKAEYDGRIKVLSGLEFNLTGLDGSTDYSDKYACLDVKILGYHKFVMPSGIKDFAYFYLTKKRDVEKNTTAIIKALETGIFDIYAHPGYAMDVDYEKVAKACAETGTLFEINERHRGQTTEQIRAAARQGVSFIISSDAHRPEKVGGVEFAMSNALCADVAARTVNIKI